MPDYPPAPQGPPPAADPPAPDLRVADVVFLVGKERGVNGQVMLSAFETVLVESNCRNLNHGDRDSVGAFQQRPSQGWGTPQQCMNVNHAAHKYFDQAIPNDKKTPKQTPGQLAQSVQRSAYPDKYDQRGPDAEKLLAGTKERLKPKPPPPKPKPPPENEDGDEGTPPPPSPEPTPPPDDGNDNGGNRPPKPEPDDPPDDEEPWDPQRAGDHLLRNLFDVSLMEFSEDEERARVNGAWTTTLTFTMQAGNPAWHTHPVTLVDTRKTDTRQPVVRDTIPDYRIDRVHTCPQPVDCLEQSPYLQDRGPWGDEPFPGSRPGDPTFRDPGYPTRPFTAQRALYESPGDITPEWFEKVPIVDLYSGGNDLHRVTVRFYANPRNKPIRPELDPCDACGEITLPWVPARTRVRLDGRREHVEVKCPDKTVLTSDVVLYGPLGSLLEWPVFDCGMPMIVELIAQSGTLATNAWYRIQWSARMDGI